MAGATDADLATGGNGLGLVKAAMSGGATIGGEWSLASRTTSRGERDSGVCSARAGGTGGRLPSAGKEGSGL